VSGLIDLLEDEDGDIRAAAIAGLEWQDDSRAIDPLVEMLDRPEVAADLELAAMIEDAIVWLEE
jgi:HEAT repeat protein